MTDVTISEEGLKTLTKELFKEEFGKQQTECYRWEFWYHHDRSKESSEWDKWVESKSRACRDRAGRKSC